MYRSPPSLLTRLRRHRGLWVLAVAVLMIKLVAGTVCVADAPEKRFVSTTTISAASMHVDTVAPSVSADDANGCLLGEGSGCHCACAHTVTLPTTARLSIARVEARFDTFVIRSGFTPAMTGSLLRPPIA
ncbi:hypothetical protein HFP05_00600 [Rhodanobacter denitrificans]|nr:hypothetical protein [Rhodanobacter denitrificans]